MKLELKQGDKILITFENDPDGKVEVDFPPTGGIKVIVVGVVTDVRETINTEGAQTGRTKTGTDQTT